MNNIEQRNQSRSILTLIELKIPLDIKGIILIFPQENILLYKVHIKIEKIVQPNFIFCSNSYGRIPETMI